MSYGIVVEGPYDVSVYEELIRKICSANVEIIPRPVGGVPCLMGGFPKLLKELEHVRRGRPVDKALVIRDADRGDPDTIEGLMMRRIQGQSFSFPRGVQLIAVRRDMETWLLADEEAVNAVALSRGGRHVASVQGTLEEIVNPKERFMRLLSQARLPYDQQVCREIAQRTKLDTLRYRCPAFLSFERKVIDC